MDFYFKALFYQIALKSVNSEKKVKELIQWYQENKRILPWRDQKNPYFIWLSEIILQQTRVAQGLPYFEKFIREFPKVQELAAASEQDVLKMWQGLGYYSRARNLHKAAQQVVNNFSGVFPKTSKELEDIIGIGPYTAAAIASIAFDEPVAVVDGNVYRVFARYFGIKEPIDQPASRKIFQTIANDQLIKSAKNNPGDFNQAVMELGALICTPKNTLCKACVLNKNCYAFNYNEVSVLPIKAGKIKKRNRYINYLLVEQNNEILLTMRGPKDVWENLFDLPSYETLQEVNELELETYLKSNYQIKEVEVKLVETTKHILTHQNIFAKFFQITFEDAVKAGISGTFYKKLEATGLPVSTLLHKFIVKHKILSNERKL